MDEVSKNLSYVYLNNASIDDVFMDYTNNSIDRTNQNDLKHYLLSINPNITWEIIQSNSRPVPERTASGNGVQFHPLADTGSEALNFATEPRELRSPIGSVTV